MFCDLNLNLPDFKSTSEIMDKLSEVYPQGVSDPMDVGWDWNSPQAKARPQSRLKKRPPPPSSPKIPMKRHPSREHFDRIREELKALKEEMARPEDEESLRLSPMQEEEFKNCEGFEDSFEPFDDDFFNDGLDQQLLECVQQVENNPKAVSKEPEAVASTTFDDMILKMSSKQIDKGKVFKFKPVSYGSAGKMESPETPSFDKSIGILTKSALAEIDRKEKEALAKLELKKKTQVVTSPLNVSLEEIEKKRLQALAKREAKRQEEIIERKRQEALKRLESNRMKHVKPLTNRLN